MKSIGYMLTESSGKRSNVLDLLRHEIVGKQLAPGTRLPPRRQWEGRLGVSGITVQWALERLAQDGLIEARGRHGTFVTDRPPHLYRYALVFPHPRAWRDRSRFWEELAR